MFPPAETPTPEGAAGGLFPLEAVLPALDGAAASLPGRFLTKKPITSPGSSRIPSPPPAPPAPSLARRHSEARDPEADRPCGKPPVGRSSEQCLRITPSLRKV